MKRLLLVPVVVAAVGVGLALWALRSLRNFDDIMLTADSEWWGGDAP